MGRTKTGGVSSGRKANRAAMRIIAVIVCILFAVLLFQEINLRQRIRYNDEIRENLTEEMREENARKDKILAQKEYMETDDYVREIARDYLGLVDENDIILKKKGEP
ncbi:MAG TPA: cell division protein FtsH [Lachnospiraceae bacterium]|nr:cell division protein FtsH [Lachnospiraceae bacterium]